MVTVLIPTSGTGSRLGDTTNFTNKSLVKIGDVYAITRILRLYPSSTEFIITLGHFGTHVKQYIQLAHPDLQIRFVEVDNYKGEGSSLGYSMLHAKDLLQKPFYFHCCDTILLEEVPFVTKNCLFGSLSQNADSYATIQCEGSRSINLFRKGEGHSSLCYIGLAYIDDWKIFWEILQGIYESNPNDSSLSDVYAIQRMIRDGTEFDCKELNGWYDTGNPQAIALAKKVFPCKYHVLEKPDESLCFLETSVIKFFADSTICKKRVERGHLLYPFGPKILEASDHFFNMEKISGIPLGDSLECSEVSHLLEWAWNALWKRQVRNASYKNQCREFYKTKTVKRLQSLHLSSEEKSIVNGLHTGSWKDLVDQIDMNLLETDIFSYFHGDFILDNILKVSDGYKLVDWRQDFDGNLEYGDMAYDLAKLRHNLYFHHANILANLYTVEYDKDTVYIDIKCNFVLLQHEKSIEEFCLRKGISFLKIKILTSLIWLNMAPLYTGKLSEFLFYFGKFTLASTLRTSISIL